MPQPTGSQLYTALSSLTDRDELTRLALALERRALTCPMPLSQCHGLIDEAAGIWARRDALDEAAKRRAA
jgi:hypothetical protein